MQKTIDQEILQFSYDIGLFAFMNGKWVWPITESLHFMGLCLLIGAVGLFDLRMLGLANNLSLAALHRFVPLGIVGYCLNVITGCLFFLAAPAQYLYNPAFQLKLMFMAGAGINMAVFYATTASAVRTTPISQPLVPRAMVMAAISLACWMGVITCGRLLTFFRPPYHWCFWCG